MRRALIGVGRPIVFFCVALATAFAESPRRGTNVVEVPRKYFVNYPAAEWFCPPIRTALQDAATTTTNRVYRGRRVRQHPNGGYGIAMMEVAGQSLYHTGADVGWFRVDEPVFAIADGVVRISQPGLRATLAGSGVRIRTKQPIDFGNLIVIEHRGSDDRHFCSLYAHLSDDRRVITGDLVTAGQHIGFIGRNSPQVNGGYEPHLHFGVSEGPMISQGQELLRLQAGGQQSSIRLAEAGEDRSRVTVDPVPSAAISFDILGQRVELVQEPEGFFLPSFLLYSMGSSAAGRFAGYAPNMDGWRDPIALLREGMRDGAVATPYFVTVFDDDAPMGSTRFVLGNAAPAWNVSEWVRKPAAEIEDVGDYAGRVVCLVCFQLDCQASQSHGLPALARLGTEYADDAEVAVVGLLTAAADSRKNSLANLESLQHKVESSTALGRCVSQRGLPPIVDDYRMRGTPWTVLIDREGVIQFSNYMVRPEETIRRIEELK